MPGRRGAARELSCVDTVDLLDDAGGLPLVRVRMHELYWAHFIARGRESGVVIEGRELLPSFAERELRVELEMQYGSLGDTGWYI